METVGVRDLKAHLSRHLKRVRGGARLVVTDRGRAVATIAPVQTTAGTAWARRLVAEGSAQWSGGKPAGAAGVRGRGPTVSDAVLEDRG
jgi:prevent-host-death family protein